MVQNKKSPVKEAPKRRGRPPSYDADAVLGRALETFWTAGFAATSLDDLGAAMGMNRPSLYGAFGDKQALYLKTMERYRATARAGMGAALAADRPLREVLRATYGKALTMYLAGQRQARGCFLIGTAAAEAVTNPEVRDALRAGLQELDDAFETRMRIAKARGELPRSADPAMLARLASAVLHTLAVRARAGESRAALEATADAGVAMICGEGR
jgi:AcrR family transcriptional regulator